MNSDWAAGYRAELDYLPAYFAEVNPLRIQVALMLAGVASGPWRTACELGFGQGLSLAVHAAAGGLQWHGTDFMPSHVQFARELTAAAGMSADLACEPFETYCARDDLPEFDLIVVHGVWSWVSEANRAAILNLVRRRLRPGGVLYLSYNTEPALAGLVPLRTLMWAHSRTMTASAAGPVAQVEGALEFITRVLGASGRFAAANPGLAARLDHMRTQSRTYLVHEYLNAHWRPTEFVSVAADLMQAQLSYVGSATILDHVEGLNLTGAQQALLEGIADPVLREATRDVLTNQSFRRDLWVKGGLRPGGLAMSEALDGLELVLTVRAQDVVYAVNGALGDMQLNVAIYRPIVTAMSDHAPRRFADLLRLPDLAAFNRGQLTQAVTVLIGKGDLAPVAPEAVRRAAVPATAGLNRHLCDLSRGRSDLVTLASPVLGGGVRIDRFQQLFLLARLDGAGTPEEIGRRVWPVLRAQGERLVREGREVEGGAANEAALIEGGRAFLSDIEPHLKALGIG